MEKLKSLIRLEESLSKLPSVGKRSAERMAFAMLEMEEDDLKEFCQSNYGVILSKKAYNPYFQFLYIRLSSYLLNFLSITQ